MNNMNMDEEIIVETQATHPFDSLTPKIRQQLQHEFQWIIQPVLERCRALMSGPFFHWLHALDCVELFAPTAKELYFPTYHLPRATGLLLSSTPINQSYMLSYLARHTFTEACQHELLLQWMLNHKLMQKPQDILAIRPKPATKALVNFYYRSALERELIPWVISIHYAIDLCHKKLFQVLLPKMSSLGADDPYFHINADESDIGGITSFQWVEPLLSIRPHTKHLLIQHSLDAIDLWDKMLGDSIL